MHIQLYLEGQGADQDAADLVATIDSAELVELPTSRSIDWAGVVDIAKDVTTVVGSVSGIVSLAHTLWKWRQEHQKAQKAILQKEADGQKTKLILDHQVTQADIEHFLQQ